jgi:hypothetical protein
VNTPTVFVGMPTRGHAYVPSVLQAIEFARRGSQGRFAPLFEIGGPVDAVRTRIVERFLETDATHLMMLDDDVVAPDEALERLLALDAPVATAACPFGIGGQIFVNAKPNAGREWPTAPVGAIEKTRQAGLACSIIARTVFDRVAPPWFVMGTASNGRYVIGEDVWFCNRVSDAGLQIVCDSTIVCSHVKDGIDLAVLAGWKTASETGRSCVPAASAPGGRPGYTTAGSL